MRWHGRDRVLVLTIGLLLPIAAAGLAAEQIVVDGSTGVMPLVAALAQVYQERHPGVTIEMGQGLGTKARLQALADGTIDIALASHGLDIGALAGQGMTAHEIAKVAVVFGVHAGVPVTTLSEQQICEVYAGQVTNWTAQGGPDLPITPYTRPDSEVDAEVVRAKIGCLRNLKMAEHVQTMARSGDMAKALAATAGAVGMTTMTVVEQSQGQIVPVALNGVAPTAEHVQHKRYPLTRDSFLVTKAQTAPAVAQFLAFIRSPEGERVIRANGAIPVQ
jgi:phosphate transport system substrate-binding protein